jgi:hypothetical protein
MKMMSSVALFAGILAVPAGWSNRRIAKTAAATVVGAEQGGTIALGGNAFYRLTFKDVRGLP